MVDLRIAGSSRCSPGSRSAFGMPRNGRAFHACFQYFRPNPRSQSDDNSPHARTSRHVGRSVRDSNSRKKLPRHNRRIEPSDVLSSGVSESRSKIGVIKEVLDCLRERRLVARIDEQRRYAIRYDLWHRGHSGGDDGERRCHRLEKDDAEAFLFRRQSKDAGVSILGGEIGKGKMPEEMHTAGDSQNTREMYEPFALGTDSDDSQDGLRRYAGEGAQERVHTFARIEMRDTKNPRRPLVARRYGQRGLPGFEIDQLRNDDDLADRRAV